VFIFLDEKYTAICIDDKEFQKNIKRTDDGRVIDIQGHPVKVNRIIDTYNTYIMKEKDGHLRPFPITRTMFLSKQKIPDDYDWKNTHFDQNDTMEDEETEEEIRERKERQERRRKREEEEEKKKNEGIQKLKDVSKKWKDMTFPPNYDFVKNWDKVQALLETPKYIELGKLAINIDRNASDLGLLTTPNPKSQIWAYNHAWGRTAYWNYLVRKDDQFLKDLKNRNILPQLFIDEAYRVNTREREQSDRIGTKSGVDIPIMAIPHTQERRKNLAKQEKVNAPKLVDVPKLEQEINIENVIPCNEEPNLKETLEKEMNYVLQNADKTNLYYRMLRTIVEHAPHRRCWKNDINSYVVEGGCYYFNPLIAFELARDLLPNEKWKIVSVGHSGDVDGDNEIDDSDWSGMEDAPITHFSVMNENETMYFDLVGARLAKTPIEQGKLIYKVIHNPIAPKIHLFSSVDEIPFLCSTKKKISDPKYKGKEDVEYIDTNSKDWKAY
jgi:hypothetical protein